MSMITLEPQSAGYNGNNKYRLRNEGMVIMEIVPGPWWAVDEATNTATIDATYVYPYLVATLTGEHNVISPKTQVSRANAESLSNGLRCGLQLDEVDPAKRVKPDPTTFRGLVKFAQGNIARRPAAERPTIIYTGPALHRAIDLVYL